MIAFLLTALDSHCPRYPGFGPRKFPESSPLELKGLRLEAGRWGWSRSDSLPSISPAGSCPSLQRVSGARLPTFRIRRGLVIHPGSLSKRRG